MPQAQVGSLETVAPWAHGSIWKVEFIGSIKKIRGVEHGLVKWHAWGVEYASWEKLAWISDEIISRFRASRLVNHVDISPVIDDMREKIARALTDSCAEMAELRIDLPCASIPAIADKWMEWMASPQTRGAKAPLPIEKRARGSRCVRLDKLKDIDFIAMGELTRPGQMQGGLRFNAGRDSQVDMMRAVFPLEAWMEPLRATSWRSPTCKVYLLVNTVRFNGLTGAPEIHPDCAKLLKGPNMDYIVADTRRLLVAKKVQHYVVEHGWCRLPAHKWQLPKRRAMPAHTDVPAAKKAKKAKAKAVEAD